MNARPANGPLDAFFPLAYRYRGGSARRLSVREGGASARGFAYSERHLQCLWSDPALRPAILRTHEGEELTIEDPGVWNLEAGPDFLGAVLRVGPDQRRLAGDVEIHIHPHDWRSHGHAEDPRYGRVRLHVTFFPGTLKADELPPGALQVSLRDALAARPAFSFENIEVAAYPFAARAARPPCLELLKTWEAPEKQLVLDAAGHERLRRKAARLAARIETAGPEQALYEEVMAALGYQHNKAPFRLLAERVPLEELLAHASRPGELLAILLGVAGLLPPSLASHWDEETRRHVRALWDTWWKHRDRWANRLLARTDWQLRGRPANHPVRRLAAAAALFSARVSPSSAWAQWAGQHGARAVARITRALQGVSDSYWDHRVSWGVVRAPEAIALIGPDRAQAIAVNVAVPFLATLGKAEALPPDVLAALPRETSNSLVRQTAFNLFGTHHPESLYRTGLRRQGLLQIFHDYCLNDRSRCAACTFPALLAGWRKDAGPT